MLLRETEAGKVVSISLSLVSMGVLSVCLSRRVTTVRDWSRLPLVCWLVLLIYVDSIIFVSGSAVLSSAYGVDSSLSICEKVLLMCLSCYMTTKFLYYFLVERAYIIRRTSKPRRKDKLYLFNAGGMLVPYCVVIVLNFYFRFANYQPNSCRIGMKRVAMIPLIGFDILVNVYLTSLFLIPLRSLYSYKNARHSQTRTVALRTFIGSCCTLVSSVINLTMVMALNGEPGWICLMCCNVDILFSVLVLHWITCRDNASTLVNPQNRENQNLPSTPPTPIHQSQNSDAGTYEPGFGEYGKGEGITGVVTTMVTATKDSDDGISLERINTLPPGVVTVEVEHVRVVEGLDGESCHMSFTSEEGNKKSNKSMVEKMGDKY